MDFKNLLRFVWLTVLSNSLWFGCTAEGDQNPNSNIPFIITFETTNPDEKILIPTNSQFNYDYTVDWGDGDVTRNGNGDLVHSYAERGIHSVLITGSFPALGVEDHYRVPENYSSAYSSKLRTVEQWGDNQWISFRNAFNQVQGLVFNAQDIPDLTSVTDMSFMFLSTIDFNSDISSWDVSNVKTMEGMFSGCLNFNQNIGSWNVSNVNNMSRMFFYAENFNQDISGWDVSSMTDMSMMFAQAFSFNQDIGNWNVSSVTNISQAFFNASNFNQDIGKWDVSNVTDMFRMFGQAISFNQDIGDWDVSNVTNMGNMFTSAKYFNQDLSRWNTENVVSCVSFGTGSALEPENLPTAGDCRFGD